MSTSPPLVVADRYRLVAPLGQGGMGRVWRATDVVLHREVAIKELVPPPGLTPDERQEMRERSLREARAIARLNNINVVRVFDVLRTDADPWIVMEYVPSRSLQDILASDGPFHAHRAGEIGLGVLGALRAAHRAGVVHRDVKPGNVLIGEDGRVVLTDFGLATVPGDPNVTRTGLVLGSPAYIAPERARDGTAGPGADLWSLGATLYAAVEGASPFARPSAIATLAALATENPPPSRNAGPLKPVLNGLLRKDPAHRINAEETERLLLRATGRRSRLSFPMSATMRRPGAGRERPPLLPGISGSAPVVPGPRPPVAPGRPPANPTGRPTSAPPVTPGRSTSIPPVTPGRSTSIPPVTPGRSTSIPPVTPGRATPSTTTGRATPSTSGRATPPTTSGRAAPPVPQGRAAAPSRPPIFTPGKATVGRARPGDAPTRIDPELSVTRVDNPAPPSGTAPAKPASPTEPGSAVDSDTPLNAQSTAEDEATAQPGAATKPSPGPTSAIKPSPGPTSSATAKSASRQATERAAELKSEPDATSAANLAADADSELVAVADVDAASDADLAADADRDHAAVADVDAVSNADLAADAASATDNASVTDVDLAADAASATDNASVTDVDLAADADVDLASAAETELPAGASPEAGRGTPLSASEELGGEAVATASSVDGSLAVTGSASAKPVAGARAGAASKPSRKKGRGRQPAAAKPTAAAADAAKTSDESPASATPATDDSTTSSTVTSAADGAGGDKVSGHGTREGGDTEAASTSANNSSKASNSASDSSEASPSPADSDEPGTSEASTSETAISEAGKSEAGMGKAGNREAGKSAADNKADKKEVSGSQAGSAMAETPAQWGGAEFGTTVIPPPRSSDSAQDDVDGVAPVSGAAAFATRPVWQPMNLRPPSGGRRGLTVFGVTLTRRQTVIGIGMLVAVLALVAVIVPMAFANRGAGEQTDQGRKAGPAPVASSTKPQASATPSVAPTPSVTPSSPAAVVVPDGWKVFEDRQAMFTVPLPANAQLRSWGEDEYQFQIGHRLLIIGETNQPKPDPMADWKQQEASRSNGLYNDYEPVGEMKFVDYFTKAVDWEFFYTTPSGWRQHVLRRNFLVGSKRAYSINWYVSPEDWNDGRKDLDVILKGFKPKD